MNRCLGQSAIRIFTGQNVIISDCQANEFSSTAAVNLAAYRLVVNGLQMFRCQGNNLSSTSTTNTSNQAFSFRPGTSINVYVEDCQFNGTFGASVSLVGGANMSNLTNGIFTRCQFNNGTGGDFLPIGANVTGIHISDNTYQHLNTDGLKFIDCQFNGINKSVANIATTVSGVLAITAKDMVFNGCQCSNLSSNQTSAAVGGYIISTNPEDPIPFYSNTQNISFDDCTVSNIVNAGSAFGINFDAINTSRIGQQATFTNAVITNCKFQHIISRSSTNSASAIAANPLSIGGTVMFPTLSSIFIENCKISDVRSNQTTISPNSAAISLTSVQKPILKNIDITDCDRGIVLTGSANINPNTLFQLASTSANALATPPIAIDLTGVSIYNTGTVTQNGQTITGIGTAFTSTMNPGTISFAGQSGTASQTGNIVTASVGTFTPDMVGDNITFAGYSPFIVGFINPTQVLVNTTLPISLPSSSYTITQLIRAVSGQNLTVSGSHTITVPTAFTITYDVPIIPPNQTFTNTTRANNVTITSSAVINLTRDTITSPVDLNTLLWQPGDSILYNNGGGSNIGGLVSGTTYFLIVYIPGFTERGVIKENTVSNCTLQGYQDTRTPSTSSAWINNTAVLNGTNYAITWTGTPPIDTGLVVGPYPVAPNKYYNLSLN